MDNLPLRELIAQLEKELFRLHYAEQSIKYYRRMWRQIVTFCESVGVECHDIVNEKMCQHIVNKVL